MEEIVAENGSGKSTVAIDASSDLELGDDPGYNDDQKVDLMFCNIRVLKGTTIMLAYLDFTVDETNTGATYLTIRVEDVENPADLATSTFNVSSCTTTLESAAWWFRHGDPSVRRTRALTFWLSCRKWLITSAGSREISWRSSLTAPAYGPPNHMIAQHPVRPLVSILNTRPRQRSL